MRKTTKLQQILSSSRLEFLMEGHSGLSAKIVEEAGFRGVWASGLAISASLGVRDNNEVSWTQVLEIAEFMSDATSIPILVDGDTGFGNFNNMRRFVKKLEQRAVAGVCIEDKIFPKTNSFLRAGAQPLASVEEFCGKIKAGKDAQTDDDFVIVARTEALIAGRGLAETLRRAEAYHDAGADAVLVHSKRPTPDEVFAFLQEWGDRCPVVIVPTKYFSTPTEAFRAHGISVVIWANHLLRAAIRSMQDVARQVRKDEEVMGVEERIAALGEVFRLQGDDELRAAERVYAAVASEAHAGVILAATRGVGLMEITEDKPKTMLKIGQETILGRMVTALNEHDISEINVVVGYKKNAVDVPGVNLIDNSDYRETNELYSLGLGLEHVHGKAIVLFGDIIFRKYIIGVIMRNTADAVIVVDSTPMTAGREDRVSDYVIASEPNDDSALSNDEVVLERAVSSLPSTEFDGEWTGILKLSEAGVSAAKQFINETGDRDRVRSMEVIDLLNHFVETGLVVRIHYITGHWTDIDTLADLNQGSPV